MLATEAQPPPVVYGNVVVETSKVGRLCNALFRGCHGIHPCCLVVALLSGSEVRASSSR